MDYYNNFIDHCDAYSMWNKKHKKTRKCKNKNTGRNKGKYRRKENNRRICCRNFTRRCNVDTRGEKDNWKIKEL